GHYYVASRAKNQDELKMTTKENTPDGVVIYSLYGEQHDKVVMIRQYRYPLGGYVYELPAGLVDPGENYHTAAIREMKEETGLTLSPITVDEMYQKPYFTTVGMTDESCGTVYGYASGEISKKYLESSEEIEVILADRDEVRRILKEENVALICAYMMMHFLHDEEPFGFLKDK
ncbi:MAG: NUDIX hydrolase, partial [Clostridia bacterium]|nr:NUDIX hydrolase [Clostridia bacterium]